MSGPLRGICRRLEDWVHGASGARTHTLAAAERVELGAPMLGPLPDKLRSMQVGIAPPATVTELPAGRVFAADGLVITPEGHAVADSVERWAWDVDAHPLFDRRPASERHVDAVAASLLARGAHKNFGHFLGDLLPRVQLVRDAGVHVDVWLVHRSSAAWAREGLALAGVGEEQRLEIEPDEVVSARHLVVPSPTGFAARTAPWARRAVRRLLGETVRRGAHRLWISREDAVHRRVINEAEVLAALRPFGFESVTLSGRSLAGQLALFADASVVAGAHGAGMAHLIAAPGDGAMIELFHPQSVHPEDYRLAGLAGWRYQPVLGRGGTTADRFVDRVFDHIEADVDQLREAVSVLS